MNAAAMEETALNSVLNPSAPAFEEGSGAPSQQPVLSLTDLVNYEASNAFAGSLTYIFQHSAQDIIDALMKLEFRTLQDLRQSLMEQLSDAFQELQEKKLINRRANKTIVADIYAIGASLARKSLSADLHKVFVGQDTLLMAAENESDENDSLDPRKATHQQDQHHPKASSYTEESAAHLLDLITALSDRLAAVEAELAALKGGHEIVPSAPPEDLMNTQANSDPETNFLEPSAPPFEDAPQSQPLHEKQPSPKRLQTLLVREESSKETASPTLHTSKPPPNDLKRASAEKTTSVYIGGISAENSSADLKKHLRGLGVDGQIKARILSTVGDWRSFCAVIPSRHDFQKLKAKKNWPDDAIVRPFKEKKQTKQISFPTNADPFSGASQQRRRHPNGSDGVQQRQKHQLQAPKQQNKQQQHLQKPQQQNRQQQVQLCQHQQTNPNGQREQQAVPYNQLQQQQCGQQQKQQWCPGECFCEGTRWPNPTTVHLPHQLPIHWKQSTCCQGLHHRS